MNKTFESQANRLHGLDHLRAIAILLVLVFHYYRYLPSWLEPIRDIGWSGVDLFFVLSGYLIGDQLLREIGRSGKISFRKFYLKRFFRIVPAYLAVLAIYYSLPAYLQEGTGMPPLWKFLTFTQNIGLDAQSQKTFSHAWSLCVEEHFYILLPILIIFLFGFKIQKRAFMLFIGIFLLGFVLRWYNWNEYVQPYLDEGNRREMVFGFLEKVYYPSYNRMDGLLVGVGIAAIFNFKPRAKDFLTSKGNVVLIIGLILVGTSFLFTNSFFSYNTAIFGYPLISIAYGVVLIAVISPSCILYKFKSKITFVIATLSYAIYLTHKQVFYLIRLGFEKFDFDSQSTWRFWLSLVIALLAGLFLYLLVEKPFLKLRKRIVKQGAISKQ